MSGTRWAALAAVTLTAAAVSAGVSPAVRQLMIRADVMDLPNDRSSHSSSVPRGGGWACMAGTGAGLLVVRGLKAPVPWRVMGGAAALGVIGFVDDRWSVSARPRLAAQGLAGAATGTSPVDSIAGLLLVPSVVNAVNFMDGINGISALVGAVWGANAIASEDEGTQMIGAALGGAMVGFLPHNLRRNRMFLGDVGSYFLGGVMGLTALSQGVSLKQRIETLAPLVLYFADTGSTLGRRALRGENILSAHREHTYQKLANEHRWGHVRTAALVAVAASAASVFVRRSSPLGVAGVIATYLAAPSLSAGLSLLRRPSPAEGESGLEREPCTERFMRKARRQ